MATPVPFKPIRKKGELNSLRESKGRGGRLVIAKPVPAIAIRKAHGADYRDGRDPAMTT